MGLILGESKEDLIEEDGWGATENSKIGGVSGWIQGWGMEETEKILDRGYMFLFQYAQPAFPDHKKGGTDPFGFGTVYIFAKKNKDNLPDLNDVVGFWQNS
jgi:hypothetical protein